MSDAPAAPAAPAAPEPATAPTVPEAPAQEPIDWKAESRKWEARAKANAEAAEKLPELQTKVTTYETRDQIAAWKTEVAEATGVPAALLAGSTKEEIEAHAAIAAPLIAAPQAQPSGHQPVPSAGTGVALPLNGDGIESALKNALGIR